MEVEKNMFEKGNEGGDSDRLENAAGEKIRQHGLDADEALKAFEGLEAPVIVDEETNRRLLKRIDLFMMPILCLVYGLQFLDKTTLSYASIMGLQKDLHLVGDNYQWLGSIFYFGYLIWEYPAARLLQRLPLAKYSAFNIVAWGMTLCCFAAVDNFAGAVAVRFFLGLLEASVTPGFTLITAQWYTKSEQSARIAYWFSFNGFAQILGGLIAYGIARGNDSHGYSISPWKVIFLLPGVLTIITGLIFFVIVPDSQLNAKWLSKADKTLAIERVRGNQQGIGNKHFKMYQFKEALTDPITWCLVFMALVGDIPNGGLTNFFSILLVSFEYTPQQSLLYGTPAGGVEVIALVAWGWITQRYGNRLLWAAVGVGIALLGSILIVALPPSLNGGRLAGFYLTQSSVLLFIAMVCIISSNIAGYTKKTTVAALFLISYCVGNILGPQTFRPKDAPHYVPAEITIVVCYGLAVCDLLFIYAYYRRLNRKNEALRLSSGYQKLANQEFMDLTDRENPEFIYML